MGQVTRTNFGCAKITVLTNAQIKALPITPVTLVAAIPGKIILPHLVSFLLTPWVADYTNIDVTANISVNINSVFTPPTFTGSGMLAQGHAVACWQELGRDYDGTPYDYGDLIGQALVTDVTNGAAGAFTGGDDTTELTIQVFYEVLQAS